MLTQRYFANADLASTTRKLQKYLDIQLLKNLHETGDKRYLLRSMMNKNKII